MEREGFEVILPKMPTADQPEASAWVEKLAETIGIPSADTILVGHSLGCITILRYLETMSRDQQVGACLFVAGFGEKFKEYKGGHDSFFDHELSWQDIRNHRKTFKAIHSEDDPNVGISQLELFEQKLGAKTLRLQGMGHFSSVDGVHEIPILRDEIIALT